MSNDYLQDKEFLKALMEFPHRTVYLRLVSYGLKGEAAEDEIIGVATGGSINVDGASAVRRTCQLQLTTDQEDILEYNWVFKTRFTVEIGLENTIGGPYSTEDIIWFPQGHYIITSFSSTLGTNSHNISISGQDKMCLLNGEVSGTLTAQTDFGKYEEVDEEGVVSVRVLTIREILENILSVYTNEARGNWEIELPDESGLNLLEYRGDTPVYLLLDISNSEVTNMTIYGDQKGKINNSAEIRRIDQLPSYWIPNGLQDSNQFGTKFTTGGTSYYVYPVSYGEVAGYQKTDLIFAGDLIEPAGGVITNVLDKIKNMLGEYEYYFDVNGKFYFGPKRNWLKVIWNSNDSTEIVSNQEIEYSYEFNDYGLFTSVANTPDLKNLKNDFTIWGTRKGLNQSDLPIHMRIAIDTKPTEYTSYDGKVYKTSGDGAVDWRELIYQMAWDYNLYAHADSNFFEELKKKNSGLVDEQGRTGYEQYYTDILGFWRQLYQPNPPEKYERVAFNDNSGKQVVKYDWLEFSNIYQLINEYPIISDWFIKESVPENNGEECYISWFDKINLLPPLEKIEQSPLHIDDLYYKTDTDVVAPWNIQYGVDGKEKGEQPDRGYIWAPLAGGVLPQAYYYYDSSIDNPQYQFLEYWAKKQFLFLNRLYYRVNGYFIKISSYNNQYEGNPVYYKTDDNRYELLLEYCLNNWNKINKSLNPRVPLDWLYSIYVDVDGIKQQWLSTISYDRKKLLWREGPGKYIDIETYIINNRLFGLNGNRIYVKNKTLSTVEVTNREPYENYCQTNISGQAITSPILRQEIEYYTPASDYNPTTFWNYSVEHSPETLLFWFDFIESELLLSTYGVKSIGQRNMAKTEQSVTAIYYPEALPVYFNENFQLPKVMEDYFAISTQGLSAYEYIEGLLYNQTYVTESTTINSIPIYSLEPNTRIKVKGEDYIVDKLSIPLTYDGQMNITAIKAPPQVQTPEILLAEETLEFNYQQSVSDETV